MELTYRISFRHSILTPVKVGLSSVAAVEFNASIFLNRRSKIILIEGLILILKMKTDINYATWNECNAIQSLYGAFHVVLMRFTYK